MKDPQLDILNSIVKEANTTDSSSPERVCRYIGEVRDIEDVMRNWAALDLTDYAAQSNVVNVSPEILANIMIALEQVAERDYASQYHDYSGIDMESYDPVEMMEHVRFNIIIKDPLHDTHSADSEMLEWVTQTAQAEIQYYQQKIADYEETLKFYAFGDNFSVFNNQIELIDHGGEAIIALEKYGVIEQIVEDEFQFDLNIRSDEN